MPAGEGRASSKSELSRRQLCIGLASAGGGVALAAAGQTALRSASESRLELTHPALPEAPANAIIRMQADLDRALAKPADARRWVMVVETMRCIGCNACSVACRAEMVTGPAGAYRRVKRVFWHGTGVFKPANCMQCDDPPCARAVPTGYVRKRADGIVEFDYERLRGPYAEAARKACPYGMVHIDDGRRFTDGTPEVQAYEEREFVENGRSRNRRPGSPLAGIARKCHFCSHLLDAGMLPACVTTCIGGAMYFGDWADEAGLVREILDTRSTMRLYEDWFWTHPRVYYVDERLPNVLTTDCTVCHY